MYCTPTDIMDLTGGSPQDFKVLGKPMTYEQYYALLTTYIDIATDMINQYCNVTTFEEHVVVDEMHSIQMFDRFPYSYGYTAPFLRGILDTEEDYSLSSREVFPREYPVHSIIKVFVCYQINTDGQNWKQLQERINGQAGDYNVIQRFNHCHIQITRNVPRYGVNNCKITYMAGYPAGHKIWSQLKMATVMVVNNILNYKKASQEAYTIRGSSISDYSTMFHNEIGGKFISDDVRFILDRWRRPYSTPDAYI